MEQMERDERAPSGELVPMADEDPLLALPSGPQPALVDPRPDLLPTDKLTAGDFEKLLLVVAREVDGCVSRIYTGSPGNDSTALTWSDSTRLDPHTATRASDTPISLRTTWAPRSRITPAAGGRSGWSGW